MLFTPHSFEIGTTYVLEASLVAATVAKIQSDLVNVTEIKMWSVKCKLYIF